MRGAGVPNVEFMPPEEFHVSDAYLKTLLKRCSYLRNSVVRKRRPQNPRQQEITKLMNIERLEFKLSESPLYFSFKTRIQAKTPA
jgi:hypothetical protein